jgi:hypothetical protein
MPPVRFEPTISAGDWPQAYAQDRAANWDRLIYVFRPDIYGHKIAVNHLNGIVQPDNLFGAWPLFEHPYHLNGLVIASCVS